MIIQGDGIYCLNSTDFVKRVFACYERGRIAVPILNDKQELPDAVSISSLVTPLSGGGWFRSELSLDFSDQLAHISFTSGTTGAPKGVALSRAALADVVTRLNSLMNVDNSIREYIGVPVYFSFGFGRCRAVAQAGGEFYIPTNGFNVLELSRLLRNDQINAISAVPTLWRVVLGNDDLIGPYGDRVKWIEIGSQYMSRQEKEHMKCLFPNATIVQHYGLTEASRSTLLKINEASGKTLASVGRAFGNVEVKIASDGRVMIRGPHIATHILSGKEVYSPVDEDGWFTTNDLGDLDDGWLYFLGRADDVINCSGIKLSSEVLEQRIQSEVNNFSDVAVCGISDRLRGERVFVAVSDTSHLPLDQVDEAARRAVRQLHATVDAGLVVQHVSGIPRTRTNKVQRKKLELLASAADDKKTASIPLVGMEDAPPGSISPDTSRTREDAKAAILKIFRRQFPNISISDTSSFETIGGASIDFIELELELERVLYALPQNWQSLTIGELADETRDEGKVKGEAFRSEIDQSAARALCCVLIVLYHVVGDGPSGGLRLSSENGLVVLNDLLFYLRIPLFAFVAGMSFDLLGMAKLPPTKFIGITMKSLAIPTLITIIVFLAISNLTNTSFALPLWDTWKAVLLPYGHFWFIQSLIVLLVVFYLMLQISQKQHLLFLSVAMVLPIFLIDWVRIDFLSIGNALVFCPFFAAGIVFSKFDNVLLQFLRKHLTVFILTSVLVLVIAVSVNASKVIDHQVPTMVAYLISALFVMLTLISAGKIPLIRILAPFTFYIYLWHVFGTSAARRLLYHFDVESTAIHVPVGVAAGIFVPLLLLFLIKNMGYEDVLKGKW